MSVDMKYYIVGRSWGEEDFSPVVSFISNNIRDDMEDSLLGKDGITSDTFCDCPEAEELIKKTIKEELGADSDVCVSYVTLTSIGEYLHGLYNTIKEYKDKVRRLEYDKSICKASEVYERIRKDIESCESYISCLEEDVDRVKYVFNGLSFYIHHVMGFGSRDDKTSYVIAYRYV